MEEIKSLMERFRNENGRYPGSMDFDLTEYLPSARQVQRKFGGIVSLKTKMEIPIEEIDFRKGFYRSNKARYSMDKSDFDEEKIYISLVKKFGIRNVHRESPYLSSGKIRSDFIVYHHPTIDLKFAIDIFYPETVVSLVGCINHKLRKIDFSLLDYDVYLVNLNGSLDSATDTKMKNKKIALPANVRVVGKKELLRILAKKYDDARLE